jgi:hypothetical protein
MFYDKRDERIINCDNFQHSLCLKHCYKCIKRVHPLANCANLIWKFADQKVNGFGPAHIEKSHFKGIFGCYI